MKKVCTLENSVHTFAAVTNKTNKQWIYQAHTTTSNVFAHQQTNSKTAH